MKFSAIKNGLLATAAAGVMAMSVSGSAKADAVGFASMIISSAILEDVTTGTQLDITDFVPGSLDVDNSGDSFAELTEAGSASASLGPVPGGISLPMSCVGNCLAAYEDLFASQGAGGASFSRSDTELAGALITGLGLVTSVTSSVVAEARVFGEKTGKADSGTNTATSVVFVAAKAGGITFEFTAALELKADLLTETRDGAFALADAGFSVTIDDLTAGTTVLSWTPDGLPGGIGAGTENFDPFDLSDTISHGVEGAIVTRSGGGFYSATSLSLVAGNIYALTIDQNVEAQATSVPEPGTLGLLGAGLVALGVARRRMSRKAA